MAGRGRNTKQRPNLAKWDSRASANARKHAADLLQKAAPATSENDARDYVHLLGELYFTLLENSWVQSPASAADQMNTLSSRAGDLIAAMTAVEHGEAAYALFTGMHDQGREAFQAQKEELRRMATRARAFSRRLVLVADLSRKTPNESMLRECCMVPKELGCADFGNYPPKIARAIHEAVTGEPLGEKSQMFEATWENVFS